MADEYDGSIRIKTKIDTEDIDSQLLQMEHKLEKAATKTEKLSKALEELGKKKTYTADTQEIVDNIRKYQEAIDKIDNDIATHSYGRKAMKSKELQKSQLKERLEQEKAMYQERANAGMLYTDSTQTDAYKQLEEQLKQAQKNEEILNKKREELAAKRNKRDFKEREKQEQQLAKAFEHEWDYVENTPMEALTQDNNEELKKSLAGITGVKQEAKKAKQEIKEVGKTSKDLTKVSKEAHKASKMMQMFTNMSRRFLLNLLVFNVIRKAFAAMIQGITEGIRHYAAYSKDFNTVMSDLLSTTEQLKNSFGAAFAPIGQVVVPMITALTDRLINAINVVNQFLSALSGKSTWSRAIKFQKDYANAVNGTANAMSSLDELTVNNKAQDNDYASMFEEVAIDENIQRTVDKWKETFESISNAIKGLSFTFNDTSKSFDTEMDNISKKAHSTIASLRSIFGNAGNDLITLLALPFQNKGTQTIFSGITSTAIEALTGGLTILSDAMASIDKSYSEHIKPTVDNIKEGITKLLDLFGYLHDTYLQPLINETLEDLSKAYEESIKPDMEDAIDNIGEIIEFLSKLWNEVLIPFHSWILENLAPIGELFVSVAKDSIIAYIKNMIKAFSLFVEGISAMVKIIYYLLTGNFQSAWNIAAEFLSKVVNGMIDMIQNLINAVVGALNKMEEFASRFNLLSAMGVEDIPDWMKAIGFNTVSSQQKTWSAPNLSAFKTTPQYFGADYSNPKYAQSPANNSEILAELKAITDGINNLDNTVEKSTPNVVVNVGDKDVYNAARRGASLAGRPIINDAKMVAYGDY